MRYAFFVGCTALARLWGYETSTRKTAERLGVELVDMPGSGCCGTTYLETLDEVTALAMAARNICIAEKMGLDIVTICNGCTEALTKANRTLKEDPELRKEINEVLPPPWTSSSTRPAQKASPTPTGWSAAPGP